MTDYTKVDEHLLPGVLGTSGSKWANAFIQITKGLDIDEDLMLGWFANAIEETKRTQDSLREWFPINSAPKDGTVIWVKNGLMDRPVKARWGEFLRPDGSFNMFNWKSELTKFDDYSEFKAGELVCPNRWCHLKDVEYG